MDNRIFNSGALIAIFIISSILLSHPISSQQHTKIKIYISLNGNDSWSGKIPDFNQSLTNGPFRSFERAIAAIETIKANAVLTPIDVIIRKGNYIIEKSIVLNSSIAVVSGCICYMALPLRR